VSVSVQIMTLLALNTQLFDSVALDKMKDAEESLINAAKSIPSDVSARLNSDSKMSEGDRQVLTRLAQQALNRFQEHP